MTTEVNLSETSANSDCQDLGQVAICGKQMELISVSHEDKRYILVYSFCQQHEEIYQVIHV